MTLSVTLVPPSLVLRDVIITTYGVAAAEYVDS